MAAICAHQVVILLLTTSATCWGSGLTGSCSVEGFSDVRGGSPESDIYSFTLICDNIQPAFSVLLSIRGCGVRESVGGFQTPLEAGRMVVSCNGARWILQIE